MRMQSHMDVPSLNYWLLEFWSSLFSVRFGILSLMVIHGLSVGGNEIFQQESSLPEGRIFGHDAI